MANTTTLSPILRPADVAELFVQPMLATSVAGQVCQRVTITSHDYRIPRITSDATAVWVREGEEIPLSDLGVDELVVTPVKTAGLVAITREAADDTSPSAAAAVGDSLARDVARKIDAALFGNLAAPAPRGLEGITGAGGVTDVAAGANWQNTDAFTSAVYAAAAHNAVVNYWVANPTDAEALAKLKTATGSNQPLLQPDPTAAARSLVAGIPLVTSTAVTAGHVWGVPSDRVQLVMREDTTIDVDRSRYFELDKVGVRATCRVTFAYPQPAAIVRIVKGS